MRSREWLALVFAFAFLSISQHQASALSPTTPNMVSRRTVVENTAATLATSLGGCLLSPDISVAEASGSILAKPRVETTGILWHAAKGQALPAVPATLHRIIGSEWLTEDQEKSSGIVCISERHDDFEHHLVQLKCLQSFHNALKQKSDSNLASFSIGMECFHRMHQKYLDQFVTDSDYSLNNLKQDTNWETIWGYDFLHYAPILLFCKMKRTRVFGIHPSDEMVASVRAHGLRAIPKSVLQGVTTNDANHFEQFKRIHNYRPSGVACVDQAELQRLARLYEVQCFREEYMAESVSLEMNRNRHQENNWVAVLAGENHIIGRGGIPFRALRRATAEAANDKQALDKRNRGVYTIMPKTVDFPVVAHDAPTRAAADYVWFVDRNPQFEVNKVNAAPRGAFLS